MKGVLLGSDFIKNAAGEFKLLEINTNIAIAGKRTDLLNLDGVRALIQSNNFTSVQCIYSGLTAHLHEMFKSLAVDEFGLEYIEHQVSDSAITVPYIEDSDSTLIIRLTYDTTAIVDDEYCRDKTNIQRLTHDKAYGTKVYIPGVVDDFAGLEEFNYTGSLPNFIVRKKLPQYDREVFPTLYKVENLTQFNTVKELVLEDEVLNEFLDSGMIEDRRYIYRSVDLIVGGNLDVINLGGLITTTKIEDTIWPTTYTNGVVDKKDRPKFITYTKDKAITYVYDLDQEVLMGDLTKKTFETVQEGDTVKAIHIEGLDINESNYNQTSWTGSYDNFIASASLVDTVVDSKSVKNSTSVLGIKLTLDDGTIWNDLENSVVLIKENDTVTFRNINNLKVGDTLCTVNVNTTQTTLKTITGLEVVFLEGLDVGELDVEPYDVYLPMVSTDTAVIQHNACKAAICAGNGCNTFSICSDCSFGQCAGEIK
jgi:hypothetical protein